MGSIRNENPQEAHRSEEQHRYCQANHLHQYRTGSHCGGLHRRCRINSFAQTILVAHRRRCIIPSISCHLFTKRVHVRSVWGWSCSRTANRNEVWLCSQCCFHFCGVVVKLGNSDRLNQDPNDCCLR